MDPFTQLVLLAHKENWCWNINCTTCGHLHYRYAFLDLASGRTPDGPEWRVHISQTSYPEINDREAPPHRSFRPDVQRRLLRMARELDLGYLIEKCGATFVLGALGLVLYHTEPMERMHCTLSRGLKEKLEPLLLERGHRPEGLWPEDRKQPLHWHDLERFERLLS